MKTKINQIFGSVAENDLQVYKLTLDLENSTEQEALESGWLMSEGIWYCSRSVRINVDSYKKTPKMPKKYTVSYQDKIESLDEIQNVYAKFIDKMNLKALYNIESDLERASWILVRDTTNRLVAFSKMLNYDGGLETQFTALDYSDPKASIGTRLLAYEIDLARKKNLKYLYVGSGYGEISTYKSSFDGFEWWTGTSWSTDVNKYIQICLRDDSIKTLEQLSGLMNETAEST
jgi:hypothetical protein